MALTASAVRNLLASIGQGTALEAQKNQALDRGVGQLSGQFVDLLQQGREDEREDAQRLEQMAHQRGLTELRNQGAMERQGAAFEAKQTAEAEKHRQAVEAASALAGTEIDPGLPANLVTDVTRDALARRAEQTDLQNAVAALDTRYPGSNAQGRFFSDGSPLTPEALAAAEGLLAEEREQDVSLQNQRAKMEAERAFKAEEEQKLGYVFSPEEFGVMGAATPFPSADTFYQRHREVFGYDPPPSTLDKYEKKVEAFVKQQREAAEAQEAQPDLNALAKAAGVPEDVPVDGLNEGTILSLARLLKGKTETPGNITEHDRLAVSRLERSADQALARAEEAVSPKGKGDFWSPPAPEVVDPLRKAAFVAQSRANAAAAAIGQPTRYDLSTYTDEELTRWAGK